MEKEFVIPILYQDEHLVVVNKPISLPVHKNDFMQHDAPYLTKLVGNMLEKWIFNVHRLDSKTSGAILLALSTEIARDLTLKFERREVRKTYNALVVGNPGEGVYDRKVKIKKRSKFKKPAISNFRTLKTIETEISYKDKENVSLSLVEINPITGRWHQIRQHFANNKHDIIGDSVHGDFTLNRILEEKTGIDRLMLHSSCLEFVHPVTNETIIVQSELPEEFNRLLSFFS